MFVHHASKSLLVQAAPAAIDSMVAMMPAAKIDNEQHYNVVVKHTEATTKLLREMGHAAPSPIISYYDFPKFKGIYTPFDHQRYMAEFMTLHRRCFNLSEMGSGKTNSALWAADYLMVTKKVRKVLILSPLSTLERVWQLGIFDTLMHRKCAIVHGSRDKRKAALAADVDFYICNHDGIAIGEIRELLCKRPDIDLVIVDEGSKFRNANTDKFKALQKIIATPVEKRLWWLTGTPAPSGPDNVWSQCKLVSPDRVPKFFGAFRREVMMEVSEHVWKPRENGFKRAFEAMQPAVRFTKAECLDLPSCTTEDWECELTKDQKDAFKQMVDGMKSDLGKGVELTAVNAADKLNKLRQILLGSVKAGEQYIDLDCKPRQQLVRDAVEFASGKSIIIVPFKGALRSLEQQMSTYTTVGAVNGDVPIARRNKIFQDFTNLRDPNTLLCHPTVMSHGLTLTEADVMAFYGPIYSNDEYRQVVERINRPGQTRKMTIIRIGASPVEWAIYRMLDTRDTGQASILKLYNEIATGSIKL